MTNKMKKTFAFLLGFVMVFTLVGVQMPVVVQAATKMTLSCTKKTVAIGGTYTLTVQGVTDKKATYAWTSTDKDVAKVSKTGVITGVAEGSATIQCKVTLSDKSTKTLSCKVTVKEQKAATSVKISNAKLDTNNVHTIVVGESYDFNRKLSPSKSNDKTYWYIQDEEYAEVDSGGVVTAKKAGTTMLIAKVGIDRISAEEATNTVVASVQLHIVEDSISVKAGTVEEGRKYAQEKGYTHKIYEYEVTKPEQYAKEWIELVKAEYGDWYIGGEYVEDPDEIYAEIWSTDAVENLNGSSRYAIIYKGMGSVAIYDDCANLNEEYRFVWSGWSLDNDFGFTNPMNNGDSIYNDMRKVEGEDEYEKLKLAYSDYQEFFQYLDTSRLDIIYVCEGIESVMFNYELRNPEMEFRLPTSFKVLPYIYLSDAFTEFTVSDGIEVVLGIDGTFLEKITFPEDLKYLSGCSSMYFLEEINLPDSIEVLNGFSNCPKLKQVELPENLKKLGWGAFEVSIIGIRDSTRYKSDPRLQEVFELFDCYNHEYCERITAWSEIRLPEGIEYVGVDCFSRYHDVTYYISKNTDTKRWSEQWQYIVDDESMWRKADVIWY